MKDLLDKLPGLAKKSERETKKFLNHLQHKPPKDLDKVMENLHEETFRKTDCMQCANCCKTTGPLFLRPDIDRISKYLKMKPTDFETQFLHQDEDNDVVLQQLPCVFLNADNTCNIYDVRPRACKEFPHTDRKKFYQINHLTLKNVSICPATYEIVEKMKLLYAAKNEDRLRK
ncbi:MAG: zinc/iron-chelating domain-containing protein [Flavobacteriales bacterium CG_4_9_14_3_um_filter_40_17]|nr:YkgJ family cysteine cluster protein [Flavobacteriaceae bacterium]PJB11718.1 MAG: zinc/iron-chelating domain-containing protein [Flavobacteriales bacterium CG_4_9_14_3_um_filter_40_17]